MSYTSWICSLWILKEVLGEEGCRVDGTGQGSYRGVVSVVSVLACEKKKMFLYFRVAGSILKCARPVKACLEQIGTMYLKQNQQATTKREIQS